MEEELERVRADIKRLSDIERLLSQYIDAFINVAKRYNITDTSLGYFSLLPTELIGLIFSNIVITKHVLINKELYKIITCDEVFKFTFDTVINRLPVISRRIHSANFIAYVKPLSAESYFTWLKYLYTNEPFDKINLSLPFIDAKIIPSARSNIMSVAHTSDYTTIAMKIPGTSFARVNTLWDTAIREGYVHYDSINPNTVSIRCCLFQNRSKATQTYTLAKGYGVKVIELEPNRNMVYIAADNDTNIIILSTLPNHFTIIRGKFDINYMMIPEGNNLYMFKKYIKKLLRGHIGAQRLANIIDLCKKTSAHVDFRLALRDAFRIKYEVEVYIPDHYFSGVTY